LGRSIDFNFSHVFEGIVWKTVVAPGTNLLLLEVRNSERKQVSFSALDSRTGQFVWRDILFDEPWWISLGAATGEVVLFTIYLETTNPDKKAIFAYHIFDRKILWWNNDFSLVSVSSGRVRGMSSKFGNKTVILDVFTGKEASVGEDSDETPDGVVRPQQYLADNEYFASVKRFLERKFNLLPVTALEYLEHDSIIFVSFYIQEDELANHLLTMSSDGQILLHEKLDEHLKGIGLDTFFVFSGSIFYVKNKAELVSYRIV
jgi:Domain of unknown function (DUF4905)